MDHSIEIDKHTLDEEWVEQPSKMRRAAARMADAKRDMDYSKSELEETLATTSLHVRKHPQSYGLVDLKKAPTEAMIEATVRVQDKVIRANRKYIEATHAYNMTKAEVDALHHRKSALEDLVVLWTRDYYSEPTIPHDQSRAARNKYQDQVQSGPRWRETGVRNPRDRREE